MILIPAVGEVVIRRFSMPLEFTEDATPVEGYKTLAAAVQSAFCNELEGKQGCIFYEVCDILA
jgi:hypothetical protein